MTGADEQRVRVGAVALALAVGAGGASLAGCAEEELDGSCALDPLPTAGPTASVSPRAGFVRVQDVLDRTLDDTGVPRDLRSGRVQAGFGDASAVTSTPAVTMPLSDVCFG